MKRRDFITLLGGATVAWPLAARAQQTAIPVVGVLHGASEEAMPLAAFLQGLSQTGYVGGKNVVIEYRWANGQYDRLPAMAAELVARQVSVIATFTTVAAVAAKKATASIPIVFNIGSDPIKDGLVGSLNHPGGNITGATFFGNLLVLKRAQLLHELVPNAKLFGILVNSGNPNAEFEINEAQNAAAALGVRLVLAEVGSEKQIDNAIANLAQQHADALLVASDASLQVHDEQIAKLAIKHALPTCFSLRTNATAGALMTYGASNTDSVRQVGIYVGRILRGEEPGDLPVQQPTKFEFVINMTTAKALGLSVPTSMQLLADEVIE